MLNPNSKKEALLKAAKERAQKTDALATTVKKEYIHAENATTKIRIVFDNSGSMAGTPLKNAKKGVVEFLRNCTVNRDAVAIHLLENPSPYTALELSPNIINSVLMTDLALLASNVDSDALTDWGSTPLFETIINAIKATPQCNRMIAFSDGDPDPYDAKKEKSAIELAVNNKLNGEVAKIPIDTVYFGAAGTSGAATLKRVAEMTGGIFLVFDPAKGVNFATAFKYLAPVNRLQLMNEEFKAKLQRGEIK